MLAPPPLRQMMDGIKSISEQNDNDLLDMQAHDPSKHPFHQFICEKMQTLQEVIEIASTPLFMMQSSPYTTRKNSRKKRTGWTRSTMASSKISIGCAKLTLSWR